MDIPVLNSIGIWGIVLSAIPFCVGLLFMSLPALEKYGLLVFPASIIYTLIRHYDDVEYGFSLFWKSSLILFPSILLVKLF
ncbi:hypothetical protein NBRC116188_22530 [Oceaniserpentilla sp. 4NH20-0058]|uniref:hypothetical protein n=1 Tax=Oceaniserpentilla sp. 4NH20-0058 TaxID=3127660 RepID=UPI003105A944